MTAIDPRPGCMGRIGYTSPQQALDAKAAMNPKVRRRSWGKDYVKPLPTKHYLCETCKLWHLGLEERRK